MSKLERMDRTGRLIRHEMSRRGIRTKDLSSITGLSPRTIENVIYGRSRGRETLSKIATVLDLNIEDLVTYKSYIKPSDISNFDIALYTTAMNILNKRIQLKSIKIDSKEKFDTLMAALCKFLSEDPLNLKEADTFCDGMLAYGTMSSLFSLNIINNEIKPANDEENLQIRSNENS